MRAPLACQATIQGSRAMATGGLSAPLRSSRLSIFRWRYPRCRSWARCSWATSPSPMSTTGVFPCWPLLTLQAQTAGAGVVFRDNSWCALCRLLFESGFLSIVLRWLKAYHLLGGGGGNGEAFAWGNFSRQSSLCWPAGIADVYRYTIFNMEVDQSSTIYVL